jgi:hypothetical protein
VRWRQQVWVYVRSTAVSQTSFHCWPFENGAFCTPHRQPAFGAVWRLQSAPARRTWTPRSERRARHRYRCRSGCLSWAPSAHEGRRPCACSRHAASSALALLDSPVPGRARGGWRLAERCCADGAGRAALPQVSSTLPTAPAQALPMAPAAPLARHLPCDASARSTSSSGSAQGCSPEHPACTLTLRAPLTVDPAAARAQDSRRAPAARGAFGRARVYAEPSCSARTCAQR